jgi:hypothetical protein
MLAALGKSHFHQSGESTSARSGASLLAEVSTVAGESPVDSSGESTTEQQQQHHQLLLPPLFGAADPDTGVCMPTQVISNTLTLFYV